MKAQEIQPGDRFEGEGATYTVVRVADAGSTSPVVRVLVKFDADGGTDIRTFDRGQNVPLVRCAVD